MLKIYAIAPSLYCAKLRIALRFKSVTWEEVPPPGGYGSEAYRKIVPSGNLPALQDGDLQVADSEAIAEYLEERFPAPAMLPVGPGQRALVRERSRFHDTRLEPAVRELFQYMPGRTPPPEGFIAMQSLTISERLAQLAQLLGKMPEAGMSLTLADCGYPVTFAWLDALIPRMGLKIVWPLPVLLYRGRLADLQPVAEEMVDYTPRLNEFLSAQDRSEAS